MGEPNNQPNLPKIPNNFNQGIASLLEEALVSALTPIVERLERIEDWMIAQPPVAQEQLNYALEPVTQQLANQDKELIVLSCALNELANSGEVLADTLSQREQGHNHQLQTLSAQVQELIAMQRQQNQRITSLEQRLDNLIDVLLPLPKEMSSLSRTTSNLKQQTA